MLTIVLEEVIVVTALKVVAVVIPFRCFNGKKEFLLLNRGNGKWAFSGGNGGFLTAKDFQDFAKIEFEYDTGLSISEFRCLGAEMSPDSKQLTVVFTCDLTYDMVNKGKWFTQEAIERMAKLGKIAFGNDKLIKQFVFIPRSPFPSI